MFNNFASSVGQHVRDGVPGANWVWGSSVKQSRFTPLQERVNDALDNMRVTGTWKSDMTSYGYTRRGGLAIPEPAPSQLPQNPLMQQMYITTSIYTKMLTTDPGAPMKDVADIRKQMESLKRSPMSPSELRDAENGYIKQIEQHYEQAQATIRMLNSSLSGIAGVPVDIRHVNWTKGPEQFSGYPPTASGSPAP
jgi:hypothetical protein